MAKKEAKKETTPAPQFLYFMVSFKEDLDNAMTYAGPYMSQEDIEDEIMDDAYIIEYELKSIKWMEAITKITQIYPKQKGASK